MNEHLDETYSPFQLIALTALVIALGFSVYQFLFNHDEGETKPREITFRSIVILLLDLRTRLKHAVFRLVRRIPYVQREIVRTRDKTVKSVCEEIAKSVQGHEFAQALPENGLSKVREKYGCRTVSSLTFSGGLAEQTRTLSHAEKGELPVRSSFWVCLQVTSRRDVWRLSSSNSFSSTSFVHH